MKTAEISAQETKYSVKIDRIGVDEARPFILNWHYAKRMCPITHAFGAFETGNLIGVVTYGTPLSSTLKTGVCGERWSSIVLELNRLCCKSEKNLASRLVSASLKMLPRPTIVVSYADTGQGHVGYVYQATNWIYTGLSSKFKDPMVRGMEHKHHTTIGDEGRGHESRVKFLREKYGEENVYYIERNRKHRYVYFCGTKKQKKELSRCLTYEEQPYPKGASRRYDIMQSIETQQTLFA